MGLRYLQKFFEKIIRLLGPINLKKSLNILVYETLKIFKTFKKKKSTLIEN